MKPIKALYLWRTSALQSSGRMFASPFKDAVCHKSHSTCKCSDRMSCLKDVFKMLDADFLRDDKLLEIEKGAKECNVPIIRSNRELVAFVNGGLKDPSVLVFQSKWFSDKESEHVKKTFSCPSIAEIQRPKIDEDIAFMSVLELGHLIKNRKISSEELTEIFIKRLKRYNHVLEAVVTITEELAYRQAKEADRLMSQGVYLDVSLFDCGLELH